MTLPFNFTFHEMMNFEVNIENNVELQLCCISLSMFCQTASHITSANILSIHDAASLRRPQVAFCINLNQEAFLFAGNFSFQYPY